MQFCTLTVPLLVTAVQDQLAKSLNRLGSPYRGDVTDSGFRAVRLFSVFNRAMPAVITGRFERIEESTVLHMSARPTVVTAAIFFIWTMFFGSLLYNRLRSVDRPEGYWLEAAFYAGLILVLWFAALVGTAIEARRFEAFARRELCGELK